MDTERQLQLEAELTKDVDFFDDHSVLRWAVWSWYSFKQNASLLEVGAGRGALTGFFASKCEKVVAVEKNSNKFNELTKRFEQNCRVTTLCGTVSDYLNLGKFDYIVFNGTFEYQCDGSNDFGEYIFFLHSLKSMLKPNGTILIAADNKLGVQYLCGKPNPVTLCSFDSYGRQEGRRCFFFGHHDYEDIISKAGYSNVTFLYPLPDWRYTQEIYSDKKLPSKKVMERLVSQYTYIEKAVGDERELLTEFIGQGVFSKITNSFLIVISDGDDYDKVDYATISSDREPENSFITMIRGGEVVKKSFYSFNETKINDLQKNHDFLRGKGIPVIESKIISTAMHMKYIDGLTLSEKLLVEGERYSETELISIFDKLWDYIYKAEGLAKDMVPFNCFVDGDEWLFFDQEFLSDESNPEYVMFRAIFYSYSQNPSLDAVVNKEKLLSRYGILEGYDKYREMERNFVAQNRQYDKNRIYWGRANCQKPRFSVGYVAGVFDMYHVGHLNLLRQSKEMCKYLIVGVLTDELVEHFKGHKPVISQEDRMNVLRSVKYVDCVVSVSYENIDKIDAWNRYHFDCLFSGDDWKGNQSWEQDKKRLNEVGSDIMFFGYTQGVSSSVIRERIGG